MILSRLKMVAPLAAAMLLAGCGAVAVPPPPAMVPMTSVPGTNPLNSLNGMVPNSDVGDALKGLGALSQLGTALDAQGNLKDPNAMNNFVSNLDQIQKDMSAREYAQKEAVDFPGDAPDALKGFAYTGGKLVNATYESMEPVDLRLVYDTMDSIKTIGDFYKNVSKNLPAGWKVVSQSAGATAGSVEVQMKQGTREDRVATRWEMNNGIAEIHIRSWTYSQ